ncbi:M1 family metallopeptidase [Micromonospora profundi]|uniref:M1 family metallopeptidase n=1 Tax=Micromonospora profundi TaxID=1420889 RepID=A0AAJ6L0F5_9ACTN|nr:M1 family metallopeptidase [Micromonospora profundi]WLS48149.1 M1 family metallopeptidase [Micromonospora profundi]
MPSLTRVEATARGATITVESYQVDLDLTGGGDLFRSRVEIRFRATPGAATFAEIKPHTLLGVRLNDRDLDPGALADNRLPLSDLHVDNTLVVEAEMAYSNTGEGMHRFVDPADGETYLYAVTFLDNVQRIFAAFDQPDLKASFVLTVTAPPEWTVVGNAELAANPAPGRWEFAPTAPLATYFFSLIAGPYHVRRAEHDGVPLGIYVVQTAPESAAVLRPHRIGVGRYSMDGTVERDEVDLDPAADGGRTVLGALTGAPAARLLLLNDGDLTFAKVRLDPASADAVRLVLPGLADPLTRAVLWGEALDAATDGERPVTGLVDLMVAALPAETEVIIAEDVLTLSRSLVDRYLDPLARSAALARIAGACRQLLDGAPAGESLQLAAARAWVAATTDADLLTGWLAGREVPAGLKVDAELRWSVLCRLVVLGAAGAAEIAAEVAADPSSAGAERAALCRAALPDAAAKQAAWEIIVRGTELSNRLLEATAEGFWQPEQAELTAAYVERYFAEMPDAARGRTPWTADRVAKLAFPRYAVAQPTREAAAALLARDDLTPGLRRVITDADDDLRRALVARTAVAAAAA